MGSSLSREALPIFVHGEPYELLNVIGRGGDALVYRCRNRFGRKYAAKIADFSKFHPSQREHRIHSFMKEARMMQYLASGSPYFVNLIDYEYRPDQNIGYMIMELGQGDLRKYLQGKPLKDSDRLRYWQNIVGILDALERARIVHADIKPENLILVNGVLKLSDLGIAFPLHPGSNFSQQAVIRGTLDYMAPEAVLNQRGFKSDVWSAGAILYEMTYGRPPYYFIFDREQKIEAIADMTPISFPPLPDPALLNIIQRCLTMDANYRPRAFDLLRHPYTNIF